MGERAHVLKLPLGEACFIGILGLSLWVVGFQLSVKPLYPLAYPLPLAGLVVFFLGLGFALTREFIRAEANSGLRILEGLAIVFCIRALILLEEGTPLSNLLPETLRAFREPRRLLSFEQVWYTLGTILGYLEACGLAYNIHQAGAWLDPGEERDNYLFEASMQAARRTSSLGLGLATLTLGTLALGWYLKPEEFSWDNGWYRWMTVILTGGVSLKVLHLSYVHLLMKRLAWDYEGICVDDDIDRGWIGLSLLRLVGFSFLAWLLPKAFLPFSIHTVIEFIREHPLRLAPLTPPEGVRTGGVAPPTLPQAGGAPHWGGMRLIAWLQVIMNIMILAISLGVLCILAGALLSFILKGEAARARLLPRILIGFYGATRRLVRVCVTAAVREVRHFIRGLGYMFKAAGRGLAAMVGGRQRGEGEVIPDGPSRDAGGRRFRRGPGDTVIGMFISMVERAGDRGIGRKPSDTALEFSENLIRAIPEVEGEVHVLTESYLISRYGREGSPGDKAGALGRVYRRILEAIDRLGEEKG